MPNHEKNRDYYKNPHVPIWLWNIDSKEYSGMKSFSFESKALVYPNEGNVIIVPNCEKSGYYYENPHLSCLTNEFWF